MAEILSFASGKGGVGKTLLATAFGIHLARKGKKVLLIDGDMGMRNMDLALGLEDDCFYHILDLAEGRCLLSDVILPVQKYLDFIPASPSDTWEKIFLAAIDTVLEDVGSRYDYIVVDCPAGKGEGIHYAVNISDHVFLVVAPSWASKRSAEQLLALERGEGKCSFLLNQFSDSDSAQISFKDMQESLEEEYFSGLIPYSSEADHLSHRGQLVDYSAKGVFSQALTLFEKKALWHREIPMSFWGKVITAADKEKNQKGSSVGLRNKGLSWQSGSVAYRRYRRR